MLKDEGEGNYASYIDHIGLYFFFVACAGVSIIVWVFNWIGWKNQCCCCDFLHNPINKRLVWWISFTFLLGLLACCVAGFVTTRRFGFCLYGTWCSVDRLYYDTLNGQLKNSFPRWEGLTNLTDILSDLIEFTGKINTPNSDYSVDNTCESSSTNLWCLYKDGIVFKEGGGTKFLIDYIFYYTKVLNAYYALNKQTIKVDDTTSSQNFNPKDYLTYIKTNIFDLLDFDTMKSEFLEKYYHYAKILRGWGKVLTMIYFSLLLIAVVFSGVSMMFYACLKRQGYLPTFMHILWNIIRFFMFSFFFYGAAYGMCYLALRDAIAFIKFVFGKENLELPEPKLLPKGKGNEFLQKCLIGENHDIKDWFDPVLVQNLEDFFNSFAKLQEIVKDKSGLQERQDIYDAINLKTNFQEKDKLLNRAKRKGGLFGSFDCSYFKNDLNILYNALYDFSVESRILCALSCCIGFFGAVFVYFFLLVMHHYNNELFFDRGKSVFTGFDGFGITKKKTTLKDPSTKKRKIRSEIELSSINEGYGDNKMNQNEEE